VYRADSGADFCSLAAGKSSTDRPLTRCLNEQHTEEEVGMKAVLGILGAGFIAAALLSSPADARTGCVWNGYAWQCWHHTPHHSWRADRARRHHQRAEIRRDKHRLQRAQAELHRDIHSGSSSPAEIRRDTRRVDRAKRELREDRRALRWGD
jgi:hypothetical protein